MILYVFFSARFLMKLSNESVVVELKNSTVVQAKQPSCHPIFHILLPFSEMRVLGG